jgi:CheY-like chemotaxis protein
MRILWIEDERAGIHGIETQCEVRGWVREIVDNFCSAVNRLGDEENKYDLVAIDLILPWGQEAPDWVVENFSEQSAGLRLLEAMRGVGQGQEILDKLDMASIYERHNQTPVIVLSQYPQYEEECRQLDIVQFFCKRNYSWQAMIRTMEGFAHA